MFLAFAEGSAIELIPNGTLFIHIALILLMIWILNRTFFRPITKILEARDKNKGGKSGEAQGILQQVDTKLAKYDSAMRDARSESYSLIESERNSATASKQTRIETVKQEVTKTVETEKSAIQKQTEQAHREIAIEATKMAEKISSSILK
jgi:F-type H+-transporting ATPase subunit b